MEIPRREIAGKRLDKYNAGFDYVDKILLVLVVVNGSFSIASFVNAISSPAGKVRTSIGLVWFGN